MNIGKIEVDIINAGPLLLDGGAMFGVVPRALWEKSLPPDNKNRIPLCMNCLLIKAPQGNILVDTGAGEKGDAKFREIYGISKSPLVDNLRKSGIGPEDIDIVINSHLHFDHAGGNTILDDDGNLQPAFPNARYFVQQIEYGDAIASNVRNRASYLPENYLSLHENGSLRLLNGPAEILPGVWVKPLPGHTRAMQGVFIESSGESGIFLSDLVPTTHHVSLPYIMAYDLYPMTTLETKSKLLPELIKNNTLCFFEHDRDVPVARIAGEKGRFLANPTKL